MALGDKLINPAGATRLLALAVLASLTFAACGSAAGAMPSAAQERPSAPPMPSAQPKGELEAVDALVDAGRVDQTRVLSYLLRGSLPALAPLDIDLTINRLDGMCDLSMPVVLDALHPSSAQPPLTGEDDARITVADQHYDLPAEGEDFNDTRTWHFGSQAVNLGSFEGWVSIETSRLGWGDSWCKAEIIGEATLGIATDSDAIKVELPRLVVDTRDTLDGTADNIAWDSKLGDPNPPKSKFPKYEPPTLAEMTYGMISGMADDALPGRKASDAEWIEGLTKLEGAYATQWQRQLGELPPEGVCWYDAAVASAEAMSDAAAVTSAFLGEAERGDVAAAKDAVLALAKNPETNLPTDVNEAHVAAWNACERATGA